MELDEKFAKEKLGDDEARIDAFFAIFSDLSPEDGGLLTDYVSMARDMGYDLGVADTRADGEMSKEN